MDLRANLEDSVVLQPLEKKLIPTGLFIELPEGYEAQIRHKKGKTENKKQTRNKENHFLKCCIKQQIVNVKHYCVF